MSYARKYVATGGETASRERLLVMLLEGAQRFLRQGAKCLEDGDKLAGSKALGRALDIVSELQATLDASKAPELTKNLADVYTFVSSKIVQARVTQSVKPAQEAERVLAPIVQAFATLADQLAASGQSHATR